MAVTLVLPPRQFAVFEGLRRGLTYQEIGDELEISRRTVEIHARVIRKKAGARNNLQLVSLTRARPRAFGRRSTV